ncbi:MAG TPA: hypothetical protein ENJ17_05605 [Gammaproteobacteria bacterium]|nr:hypothetical protein [Gammaproteobacteria bacterium]
MSLPGKMAAMISLASRIALWLILLLGGATLGVWLDLRWFPAWFASPAAHLASFIAGILLLRLVMRISRNTGRTLARLGREGELPPLETNRLVTRGPYACMRHPMHFGLLFFPLGVALLLGSLSFTLIIAPLEMLLLTRPQYRPCSAAVCRCAARHQSAAVVGSTASFDNAVCAAAHGGLSYKNNRLGTSSVLHLCVVTLANGTTIAGE